MSILQRILNLRTQLTKLQLQGYIIPSSDPHQSEYVADHWKARAWISGFTGSAGTVVLTSQYAELWTDSRYFIQAEEQLLGGHFTLHKVYNQKSPQYVDWLAENLVAGDTVGCDGRLFSKKHLASLAKKLAKKKIKLATNHDLISEGWKDRPALPESEIFDFTISYAGESRASKLKRIRAKIKSSDAHLHLVSTLDDIAWIFNIRGTDVNYNPVAYAYAIIATTDATLYLDPKKVNDELAKILSEDNIYLKSYDAIWEDLNTLPETKTILIDTNTISHSLFYAINCKNKIDLQLPSIQMKALKNEVEKQHFRQVMEKDGIALLRFYMWLEEHIETGLCEYDLLQKITECRSEGDGYQSESFGAIVGYKGNGAIVHYAPAAKGSAVIEPTGVLLIDSGGQYLNGTTDITRTVSLGDVTAEERDAYTRVLKGNIALDRAVFPEGTLGVQLDTLARTSLWDNRMNFLHGTGHGVGFFLNVHEGPQGFNPGIASRSKTAIMEHMVTTNEPGYYAAGKFGIRIENCLLTIDAGTSDSGKFLKFETLTMFPIDTSLIEMSMLTKDEVIWLNKYHEEVLKRLSAFLEENEKIWLAEKCKGI